MAVNLLTRQPSALWWADDPATNDKALAPELVTWLVPNSLVVFDLGYFAYWLFDAITDAQAFFVTRMREKASYTVQQVLVDRPGVRDQIIQLGNYDAVACQHPMRLIEVHINGAWQRYLTNVLDPERLSIIDVVVLYAARWSVETTFLLVKRLLDWPISGSAASMGSKSKCMRPFCSTQFSSICVMIVRDHLHVSLDRISIEMVYRGLYHYVTAVHQGNFIGDAAAYLAREAQELGILKQLRPPKSPTLVEHIQAALASLAHREMPLTNAASP